ncbi:YpdA family putative bacillithiol disulfide reductase [Chengkuizengella sp. 2205SS18-9]|uniref:YpdA family putative bacillithiol disulfide reductase n=2 Tax=Chengkuizengella axinellae TaxID=3064388 RepID=A0ABT9IXJ6_9BACL|nr:YpdA family putative bacillithiol disulfide reductase [Chengkuizengella sp. 2205SS18-9]MDP5274089.1 YpdA family putative bacillithiol disulfide reductase [Chengkuizengella sp. 2205SS18-9]
MEQVIIIGAGPCGLSAACELQKQGVNPLIIDKGCIVNSIYHFPTFMQFFSTPQLIEIGDVPFTTIQDKPSRHEGLNYYRMIAERKELRIHQYEKVEQVTQFGDHFKIFTKDRLGNELQYEAQHVIVATGYYDNPNLLNIPGEELAKVSHYFKEAHPYVGLKIAVVGLKNSAVDTAMELQRCGAEVTVIHRNDHISDSVKKWVRPLFESLIEKEKINMMWNAELKEIKNDAIVIEQNGVTQEMDNDFVFAMTGYHPDHSFIQSMGVGINEETGAPTFHEETMETNVKSLYIAGVLAAGNNANSIFIENGRFHGKWIAKDIVKKLNVS